MSIDMFPFSSSYNASTDEQLVKEAMQGSGEALERLAKRHQRFIFNVALKLVKDSNEAADLTQEVLIKMITKLGQFKAQSEFRTWLYRIVVNHFLENEKKRKAQKAYSFEAFGKFLDEKYTDEDFTESEHKRYVEHIISTRNQCMASMLLCLDNKQRLVFILGAIFNIRSATAAEIMGISADNFRQLLSRAKADLFRFMDGKCGLINESNPCRCSKKTKGFIAEGKVDARTKKFKQSLSNAIAGQSEEKNRMLDDLIEKKYLDLFRDHPYEKVEVVQKIAASILLDPAIRTLFHLN